MSSSNPAGVTNVGQVERIFSIAAGATIAMVAFCRAPREIALAGLAAYLAYRGATGRCPVYEAMGLSSAQRPPEPRELREPSEAQIDETVDESFPASDPPSWYTGSSFTQVDK